MVCSYNCWSREVWKTLSGDIDIIGRGLRVEEGMSASESCSGGICLAQKLKRQMGRAISL